MKGGLTRRMRPDRTINLCEILFASDGASISVGMNRFERFSIGNEEEDDDGLDEEDPPLSLSTVDALDVANRRR